MKTSSIPFILSIVTMLVKLEKTKKYSKSKVCFFQKHEIKQTIFT